MTKIRPSREQLQESYARLKSTRKVGLEFNYSGETIRTMMHKYGLEMETPSANKYMCDHDFFTRDTEETFYVAGFIAADGCVKARKGKSEPTVVSLVLSTKDEEHLERIRNLMKVGNPLSKKIIRNSLRNPNWKDSKECELGFTSAKMCQDAKQRFNIVQRKSLIYIFPEWLVNHAMVNHFMRGYFDGDGSFYKQEGVNIEQVYFNVRGTMEFLTSFRNVLDKNCALSTFEKQIRISYGYPALEYGGNGVVAEISKFFYKDAAIYLRRKYELAQQAIKQSEATEEKIYQIKLKREEEERRIFRKRAHWRLTHIHPTSSGQLRQMYKEMGTVRKVAKALGVRLSTARELLLKNNIEIFTSRLNIDKDSLETLYRKHGKLKLMAKELGCDPHTVTKYMKDLGLNFSSPR